MGNAKARPMLPDRVLTISVAIISLFIAWAKPRPTVSLRLNKINKGRDAPA